MAGRTIRVSGGPEFGSHEFGNAHEVSMSLPSNSPNRWIVKRTIGKTLAASLVQVEGADTLIITVDEEGVGAVPVRSRDNPKGVIFVANSLLTAQVGPFNAKHPIDHGLLWVGADGNSESDMTVALTTDDLRFSPGQVEEELERAFKSGEAFVSDLIEGVQEPRYSGPYSS
jgi:hypothetical protein